MALYIVHAFLVSTSDAVDTRKVSTFLVVTPLLVTHSVGAHLIGTCSAGAT